jgi:hypothetical protein
MQKMHRYVLMLLIGASLIALAGCNKLFDYIKEHPDEDCTSCKITKLTSITSYDGITYDTITAIVAYNSWGDPISVTPNHIGTGMPQYLFRYDSQHRLTDFIGAYSNGYYEQWRRYVYDGNNRIIRDTAYSFGLLNDRTHTDYGPYVTTYTYDSKGRVVLTSTWDIVHGYTYGFSYAYDTNGNQIFDGVVYDDKINFRKTNKIWMFVSHDYSVNNGKPVIGYNDKGLPLKVSNRWGFLSFYGTWLEIKYKCD